MFRVIGSLLRSIINTKPKKRSITKDRKAVLETAGFVSLLTLMPFLTTLNFNVVGSAMELVPEKLEVFLVSANGTIGQELLPNILSSPVSGAIRRIDNAQIAQGVDYLVSQPLSNTSSVKPAIIVILFVAALLLLFYVVATWQALRKFRLATLIFGLALPHVCFAYLLMPHLIGGEFTKNFTPLILAFFSAYIEPDALAIAFENRLPIDNFISSRLPYLGAIISAVWVAFSIRFYSRHFVGFILTSVVFLSMVSVIAGGLSVLRPITNLFLFFFILLILRALLLVFKQNAGMFWKIGIFRSFYGLVKAAVLWTPMLLLIIPFMYAEDKILLSMRESIQKRIDGSAKEVMQRWGSDARVSDTMRADVHFLVATKASAAIVDVKRKMEKQRKDLYDFVEIDARSLAETEAKSSLSNHIEFSEPDNEGIMSGLLNFAESKSHDAINHGWQGQRSDIIDLIGNLAENTHSSASAKVNDAIYKLNQIEQKTIAGVIETNKSLQYSVSSLFYYLSVLRFIGVILFLLVCIKSFAYIYSRVVLNPRSGKFLSLVNDGRDQSQEAHIRELGNVLTLKSSVPTRYFINRKFSASGKPPRFSLPQLGGAPFGRLFSGTLAMNRVDIDKDHADVLYTATRGAKFVEWKLAEGEMIVFSLANFMGIQDTVKISTLFSGQICTMLLGRIIYSTATGPGSIYFLADGRIQTITSRVNESSIPPDRLLAMHAHTGLVVDSENRLADIYLSTAYIRPTMQGEVLANVDHQSTVRSGVIRFASRFLWPF